MALPFFLLGDCMYVHDALCPLPCLLAVWEGRSGAPLILPRLESFRHPQSRDSASSGRALDKPGWMVTSVEGRGQALAQPDASMD